MVVRRARCAMVVRRARCAIKESYSSALLLSAVPHLLLPFRYVELSSVVLIFLSRQRAYAVCESAIRQRHLNSQSFSPLSLPRTQKASRSSDNGPLTDPKLIADAGVTVVAATAYGRSWRRSKRTSLSEPAEIRTRAALQAIAEDVLRFSPSYEGADRLPLYIPGSLHNQKLTFPAPVVLYVSSNNPGAREVALEMRSQFKHISWTNRRSNDDAPLKRRAGAELVRSNSDSICGSAKRVRRCLA
eukprot:6686452-Prymnesium_polylepis.1